MGIIYHFDDFTINKYVSLQLFILTLMKYLRYDLFMLDCVNTHVDMNIISNKLIVEIGGFNELIKVIYDKIAFNTCYPNEFSAVKTIYTELLKNYIYEQPYIHVVDLLQCHTNNNFFLPSEQHKIINNITFEIMCGDVLDLFSTAKKEIFIEGNLNFSKNTLIKNNLLGYKNPNIKELKMNEHVTVEKFNKNDPNVAVCFVSRREKICSQDDISWIRKICSWLIIEILIREPFFDTLRTKEQFGYIVKAQLSVIDCYYCIYFMVQSPDKKIDIIEQRIRDFIKQLDIENIINNKLDIYLNTLKQKLMKHNDSLKDDFSENLSIIANYRIDDKIHFNIRKLLLNELNLINGKYLIDLYREFIDVNDYSLYCVQ